MGSFCFTMGYNFYIFDALFSPAKVGKNDDDERKRNNFYR